MTESTTPGRRHGVPEGRTDRIERKTRTIYPDGTVVDGEPFEVSRAAAPGWAGLARMFSKTSEPSGTERKLFDRIVVIEAGPWTEVVGGNGEDVVALPDDQEETR